MQAPSSPQAPPLGGRLHPAVIAIWPFSQIVPLVILLFTDTVGAWVLGGILALTVLVGLVRWLRFSWRLEGGALVIEQGLLSRQRRVIPVERIQSVDLVRKVRHRLFGVVEVRIEAVGASATEGRLDALTPEEADRLRRRLLALRSSGPVHEAGAAQAPAGELLVAMTPGRLVLAGLTGGRVGIVAVLLGGLDNLLGNRVRELFLDPLQLLSTAALIGLAAAVFTVAFILSVIATAVVYWGFRLTRENGELHVRRGLLEQRLDTIPLRRVQALRVEENLVRRLFSVAAVKVDVAGRAGDGDGRESGLLLPLGGRAEAHALVARLLDDPKLSAAELAPMPRRALRRRLVRAAVVTVVPTAAAVLLAGPPGLIAALIAVPAIGVAVDAYRSLGTARVGDVLISRSGVLVRRTAYVRTRSLQSLALTANPFQRSARLATLELQIARSPGIWGGPRMVDLDRDQGEATLAGLAAQLSG